MAIPVAADIVTGFLGSGKTTLIKSLLARGLEGKKIALIVNEFGDIAIDGTAVRGINVDRMIELPNGCICCTIGSKFALAVQEIVDTVEPHLIVIETSGVASPDPLISDLSRAGVRTDAVISVVDAEQIQKVCKDHLAAVGQIEAADFIVINKIDCVTEKRLEKVTKTLRKLNPRAVLFPTSYGHVDQDVLFATGTASIRVKREVAEDRPAHPARAGEAPIESFSFRQPGNMDRYRFEAFLKSLPSRIYRAKGIVRFSGESSSSLFNYTCGRWDIEWLMPAGDKSFIQQGVFIGTNLVEIRDDILSRLRGCFKRSDTITLEEGGEHGSG